MKTVLIIDGYNCIRRTKAFEAELDASLESARRALLEGIRRYSLKKRTFDEIVTVFDGARNRSEPKAYKTAATSVLFSRPGESADELILSFMRRHSDKYRMTVVSDDNYVTNNARVYGARILSCSDFIGTIKISDRRRLLEESEKELDCETARDINEALKKAWKIGT